MIATVEDDGWQSLVPTTLVTDCRSIYDTVHKDGQHINEKGSVVHAVLLRQLLSTRRAEGKAGLMWVPTRCQCADPLLKLGRRANSVNSWKDLELLTLSCFPALYPRSTLAL